MKYYDAFRDKGYHAALLTSFEFAADIFDDVIWPGLVSGGARIIGVIADQNRVNEHFTEYGPSRRAGQRFHLAKRKVSGAFHPKIMLQIGETKGRLLVGSSNLTSGGLAGNLEAFASLVVDEDNTWATPLLAAALQYFREHCALDDTAMRRTVSKALLDASWLRVATAEHQVVDPEGHRHAFIAEHENTSVAEQFAAFTENDKIERLVFVSPFWGAGMTGVSKLRDTLGAPDTAIVVDPKYQDLDIEAFTRMSSTTLHSITTHPKRGKRRLHAKIIIACGTRADYVLTGSANATLQGLYGRRGGAGNAEACLARTEKAGTALARLGLYECLIEELSLDKLAPPIPTEGEETQAAAASRDGGSLTLDKSKLTWSPPKGSTSKDCRIIVEGPGNKLLDEVRPSYSGGSWSVELKPMDVPPLRGRIRFSPEEISAPVPIASLDELAGSSQLPTSGQYVKLLDALRDQNDFGGEALDLALKIRSLHAARRQHLRPSQEPRSRGENGGSGSQSAPAKPLTEKEFNDLDDDIRALVDADIRQGPLGAAHLHINMALGLGIEESLELDQGEVVINDLVATNDDYIDDDVKDYREDGNQAIDGVVGNNNVTGPAPPPKKKATRKPRVSSKRRAANPARLEKRLATHVETLRNEMIEKKTDPMDLEPAMILRLAILAIISDAAPVGNNPLVEFPMPAISTRFGGGWVRLLGRFLEAMQNNWQSDRFILQAPSIEQVDCMSAMIFGSSFVREAAVASGISPSIEKKFAELNANIIRSVSATVEGRTDEIRRLEQAMARYDEWHKNSQMKYQSIRLHMSKKKDATLLQFRAFD
jgi:hypothetical protein